jgi:ribosomal protein S18 acetylase RimI-like enzyme
MLREEAQYFASRWDDVSRQPDTYWQDWVGAAAEGTTRRLLVVEEDGRWVGVVGAHLRVDPTEAQLMSMWVEPDARGRGIARALIRGVAEWARERGCDRVCLFVQESNAPAQRLYLEAGFRPTGDLQRLPQRRGFKLLLCAQVDTLLSPDG